MFIYVVGRTDSADYEEYESAVVAASSTDDAMAIMPDGLDHTGHQAVKYCVCTYWRPINLVTAIVGTTNTLTEPGVILASYIRG